MLLWCATVILNGTVAFYGGAWLGRWLLAAPEIGAAGGLLNLAVALFMRSKEKPNLAQRVRALKSNRSPYSSVTALLLVFFGIETLAFITVAGVVRWLQQGGFSAWMPQ